MAKCGVKELGEWLDKASLMGEVMVPLPKAAGFAIFAGTAAIKAFKPKKPTDDSSYLDDIAVETNMVSWNVEVVEYMLKNIYMWEQRPLTGENLNSTTNCQHPLCCEIGELGMDYGQSIKHQTMEGKYYEGIWWGMKRGNGR